MRRKIWFYLTFVLAIMVIGLIVVIIQSSFLFIKETDADLQNYLEMSSENNYILTEGYIPDSSTAARVGSAILDNICPDGLFDYGVITVEYDSANRLWKVNKGYLFSDGGFVIINQDTGEIMKALLHK